MDFLVEPPCRRSSRPPRCAAVPTNVLSCSEPVRSRIVRPQHASRRGIVPRQSMCPSTPRSRSLPTANAAQRVSGREWFKFHRVYNVAPVLAACAAAREVALDGRGVRSVQPSEIAGCLRFPLTRLPRPCSRVSTLNNRRGMRHLTNGARSPVFGRSSSRFTESWTPGEELVAQVTQGGALTANF